MKINAIVRIVLFSLIIIILGFILYMGIFSKGSLFGNGITDGKVESVGSVDPSEISNINIEWVSGSITIEPGDTDSISFAENAGLDDKEKMVWKQTGDTLSIQFSKPNGVFGIHFGFRSVDKDLVITVPKDWIAHSLEIDSVSADIEIKSLTADALNLVNVSGNCNLSNCSIEESDIDTVSGKVNFEGAAKVLSLESVSANCTLTLEKGTREINMDGVSGNLTLYLPEEQGFTVEMDGISGNISSDFPTTSQNDKQTYGDGSCQIEADCVSGNIYIKKK